MAETAEVRMTLNAIMDSSCSKFSDLPAVGMAMEKALTYKEFHDRVFALASRMHREGIKKGDHIAILAENSQNWGMAYFAIIRLGAVAVPVLPDFPEVDVHYVLNEMKVKAIFITQRQIEKIYELKNVLAGKIITLDDYSGIEGVVKVQQFSEYLRGALTTMQDQRQPVEFAEVAEDDLASILYTSGTSGYSKAVMLTHKNLASNACAASSLAAIKPGDVFLSILPMSHTYEFTCGFILPLIKGCRIAYAGQTPTPAILQKLCQHEKPFAIFAVPLVFEKIYKKRILPQIEKSWMLSLVCRTGIGRRLVYRRIGAKLLEFFGGNLKLMGIGGAALNPEVENFLHQAGFPYLVGYGLTEAAPLLSGGPAGDASIACGSAGKIIPGVQVRIIDPDPATGIGEILASGPNITRGYYNDPETTRESLTAEGWLHTGDLGFMDERGNLHIRGRSKNVIVMASGENVYPEGIEHKMNACHWVVESLIIENGGKLEAWVYPDYEFIDEQTANQPRSRRHEYLAELMETMRTSINEQLSKTSRISKVYERREPFIKTATHKIKRYLYDDHAKVL
ncbi:MAG: AMP-binding protein [Desulfocapsaceae bacterium]|nr:AMP-binding protein [Desulfocapsaceae bacterium]